MGTISVRKAGLDDMDALTLLFDDYRQFYGRASDSPAAYGFLLARINNDESVLFIALDDSAAVGFAQLYPSFSSVSLARTFILNDLYVQENCRRKGMGSLLLDACAQFAKSSGAIRLTLTTAVDNNAAHALYEALGWQRDEQFQVYHLALT